MDQQEKEIYLLSKGWEHSDIPNYFLHPKNIDGLRFGYHIDEAYKKTTIEHIRPSFVIMNNIVEWVKQ